MRGLAAITSMPVRLLIWTTKDFTLKTPYCAVNVPEPVVKDVTTE